MYGKLIDEFKLLIKQKNHDEALSRFRLLARGSAQKKGETRFKKPSLPAMAKEEGKGEIYHSQTFRQFYIYSQLNGWEVRMRNEGRIS